MPGNDSACIPIVLLPLTYRGWDLRALLRDEMLLTSVAKDSSGEVVVLQLQLPDDRFVGEGSCPSIEFELRLQTASGALLTVSTVSLYQEENDEAGILVLGAPGTSPIVGSTGLPAGLELRVDSRSSPKVDNAFLLSSDVSGATLSEGESAYVAVALTS